MNYGLEVVVIPVSDVDKTGGAGIIAFIAAFGTAGYGPRGAER